MLDKFFSNLFIKIFTCFWKAALRHDTAVGDLRDRLDRKIVEWEAIVEDEEKQNLTDKIR